MAAEAAILNQSLSAGIYLVLSRFGSQSGHRHSDCLRTADLSIFREHSKASRYMIYSLLASKYWIQGKTNETLHQLNSAVANDINEVMQKGIESSSGDSCPTDPVCTRFLGWVCVHIAPTHRSFGECKVRLLCMGIQSKSLTSSHSPDLLHCYLRKPIILFRWLFVEI